MKVLNQLEILKLQLFEFLTKYYLKNTEFVNKYSIIIQGYLL